MQARRQESLFTLQSSIIIWKCREFGERLTGKQLDTIEFYSNARPFF
jgi:hypothetical protein